MKESLFESLPYFESAVAVLLLENHYPYGYKGLNEPAGAHGDFLEAFSSVKSPNPGFCLDYGHSSMCGNTDELITELPPYLRNTHLADNSGDEEAHPPFGEGSVDWADVLERTLAAGFGGPFIVEYPAPAETAAGFKRLPGEIILRRERCRDNI